MLASCGDGQDEAGRTETTRTTVPASPRATTPRAAEERIVDPCALVTRGEAQRSVGRALRTRRQFRRRLGIETCARAARDTGVFVTVIDRARDARAFRAETRKVPGVVPLGGLAEGAVYGKDAGCIRALSRAVDFSVCGRRDGRPLGLPILRSLTQRALGRLG